MRYLILSDIHSNLEALDAVLIAAPRERFDKVLVLGDIVGYGADPNAVVDRVRALAPDAIVRGNHDKVAAGVEPADGFNDAARYAALWTLHALTPANRTFLAALQAGPVDVDEHVEICHGSPEDEDEYIFEPTDAIEALRDASRPLCFFGHTHVQIVYWLSASTFDVIVTGAEDQVQITLDPERRYLVNPGSVGQPRDGDPRAAFATYDSDERLLTLDRVVYSVGDAQAKIAGAGLPEGLARRLSLGK
jgi:diadenosine tetraphosphatase ApaH/serine/threonine PP2A family protein phosphatase